MFRFRPKQGFFWNERVHLEEILESPGRVEKAHRTRTLSVRTRSTTTRDRNQQFRPAVSTGYLNILHWIPSFFSRRTVQLVRKWPNSLEKMVKIRGGETCTKSCHVSGCHGFSVLTLLSRDFRGYRLSNLHYRQINVLSDYHWGQNYYIT